MKASGPPDKVPKRNVPLKETEQSVKSPAAPKKDDGIERLREKCHEPEGDEDDLPLKEQQ